MVQIGLLSKSVSRNNKQINYLTCKEVGAAERNLEESPGFSRGPGSVVVVSIVNHLIDATLTSERAWQLNC